MNTHNVTFGSVSEVIREAIAFGCGDDANTIDERLRGALHSATSDYSNGYGWKELESAIANPPQALLDAVDSMRQRIADVAIPQRRARRICPNSEQGDELNPLAWATRDPIGW